MSTPSIRRALLVRCGIGMGCLLCLLSIGIYLTVRHGLYRELDVSIEQTAALLSNQVELEEGKITFEWQEGLGTNRELINEGLFQFWDETSGQTTRSPGLGSKDLEKFTGPAGAPQLKDIELPGTRRHARAIGMRIHPFVIPEEMERMKLAGQVIDPKTLPYTLVVAGDAKPIHRVLTRLRWILATGTVLMLGLGFILIDRAVHVSLRPIRQLSRQVRDRTGKQLYTEFDMPDGLPAELSGLAENVGSLLKRVTATRRRERDFIRHTAHELRTPIAGLRATAELALSKPRDGAEYAAHLETCRKSALQLGELVKRLSALARIGQAESSVTLQALDLTKLMNECLHAFQPAMDRRGLKVSVEDGGSPRSAIGDRGLVRIVFNNLLDNAASYAPEGSEVAIRFRTRDGRMEVSVSNPAEKFTDDPESMFEPLFRKDASRHDAESHLGIGLTLSQEAARAMDGTLGARWTPAGGIEFTLGLPLPA